MFSQNFIDFENDNNTLLQYVAYGISIYQIANLFEETLHLMGRCVFPLNEAETEIHCTLTVHRTFTNNVVKIDILSQTNFKFLVLDLGHQACLGWPSLPIFALSYSG